MAQHCSTESSCGAAKCFYELPANTARLTVGFYNVGIQLTELSGKKWPSKQSALKADIIKAFDTHVLDILCLSELGELGVGIAAGLPDRNVGAWMTELLRDSAIPPVHISTEGHYLTIAKTSRVKVDRDSLVQGFDDNNTDRSFQHLRVFVAGDDVPISIINCHAPSSKKRPLTASCRKRYLLAAHNVCAGDRFVWGGDFNTGCIQFTAIMKGIDSRYSGEEGDISSALQVCYSHPMKSRDGDLAVSYGLAAIQTDSAVGKSHDGVSDAHDLVIANVFATHGSLRSSADRSSSVASLAQPPWPKSTSSAPLRNSNATTLSSLSSCKATPWNTGIIIQPALPPSSSAPTKNVMCEMPTRQPPRFASPEEATASGSVPQLVLPSLQVKRSSPESSCQDSTPVTRILQPRHAAAIILDPEDDSSSSAAQPVRMLCLTSKAAPATPSFQLFVPLDESPSSVSLPSAPPTEARSEHETGAAAATVAQFTPVKSLTVRAPIPRVLEIFGDDAEDSAPLQDLLEKIAKEFLYDKVSRMIVTPDGCDEAAASVNNLDKLEVYLQVIQDQRAKHLVRRPDLPPDAVFDSWDMEEIYKTWMDDYTSWMNPKNIEEYEVLLRSNSKGKGKGKGIGDAQQAHQKRRRSFGAYLFQILGNKHVLLASIKYPLCSAAQPAKIIEEFMTAWEKEKATDDYKKRVRMSEKATEERKQLKNQAHAARRNLVRGIKIHHDIRLGLRLWDSLSADEETLLDEFKSGQLIRCRNDCDAAFGWDKQQRDAAGSAAARLTHQVPA